MSPRSSLGGGDGGDRGRDDGDWRSRSKGDGSLRRDRVDQRQLSGGPRRDGGARGGSNWMNRSAGFGSGTSWKRGDNYKHNRSGD